MKKKILMVFMLAMMITMAMTVCVAKTYATQDVDINARYVTPGGAGTKDGTGWENAFEGNKAGGLESAWDGTPESGTLYIGYGEYTTPQTMNIKSGGKSINELKKLVGVSEGDKKPLFVGDYNKLAPQDKGTNFIVLKEGVKYVMIDNIEVHNYSYVILTEGKNEGLRFYNMNMSYFCDGFYMDGNSTSGNIKGNKDIIIDNCKGYWHRKRFIRFRRGNADAIVSGCYSDAGGEDAWRAGNWAGGISFESNNTGIWEERILVIDSAFKNCFQKSTDDKAYLDTDGISAEKTTRDLVFLRVSCHSSSDSGFDLKAENPTLIDCVAMDNKRNFRFWSEDQGTMINCLSAYAKMHGGVGSSAGLWTNKRVAVYNSTFYNNSGGQVNADGGYISLFDCIVGYNNKESSLYSGNASYIMKNNVIEYKNEDGKFKAESSELFYGNSENWNSTVYNGKVGYHYNAGTRVEKPKDTSSIMNILDIDASYDWAKDAITVMNKTNYLPGYANVFYAPGDEVKRIDFILMLTRIMGIKSDSKMIFEDLPSVYRYRSELGTVQKKGLVKGDDLGLLRPFDGITREEMMVLLSRFLVYSNIVDNNYLAPITTLDAFADKDSISKWAKQDVANMVAKGIIKGGTDGAINPKGNVTRAEAAVIGQRIGK